MKNLKFLVALVLFSGLFLTSCEKDYLSNPLPGNTQDDKGILKDGENGEGGDVGTGDDDEPEDQGITDGGRDEDYDKSGKKKPKG